MGSSFIKPKIEAMAFPVPIPSYTKNRRNLFFIDDDSYVNNNPDTRKSHQIACMFYKVSESRNVLIYSHGNGTDIGYMHQFLSTLSQDTGINIIAYDYPGYGLTEGKASETECNRSISVVFKYLQKIGYDVSDIILYGTSIGTGPTVALACKQSKCLKGILLQTPYTSICGVASPSIEYSSNVSNSLIKNPNIFRINEMIGQIKGPITILHGDKDEVIPYSHAITLYDILQKANNLSKLETVVGGMHNNLEHMFYDKIVFNLKEFLKN